MSLNEIQNVKKVFLETGRLNRKAIDNELAMSWYKCKMNGMRIEDDFRASETDLGIQKDRKQFQDLMKSVYIQNSNLMMVNTQGQVVEKIIQDDMFELINHIGEEFMGSNAGAIALKSETIESLRFEEHYLHVLTDFCSYAIPVKKDGQLRYILVYFLRDEILHDKLKMIENTLNSNNIEVSENIENGELSKNSNFKLEDLLWFSDEEYERLKVKIRYCLSTPLPILITGPKSTGKKIIAQYVSNLISNNFLFLDAADIHPKFLEHMIEEAMCHYDTIIINHIEYLSPKIITLLTVNSSKNNDKKTQEISSSTSVKRFILLTEFTPRSISEKSHVFRRMMTYIGNNCIETVNTVNRIGCMSDIDSILSRYPYDFTQDYFNKLLSMSADKSISEIVYIVEKSVALSDYNTTITSHELPEMTSPDYQKLSDHEKAYILKVFKELDNNHTLTAEVLGIGRSTLYRKLQAYQNESGESN